jgi:CheY-like chemotaxis protein
VLVVDDNTDLVPMLALSLEGTGHDYHLTKPTDPEDLERLLAHFSKERA